MKTFKTTYTPHFHESNPGSVVAAARLLDLAHVAYERWITEVLEIKWRDWFMNTEWAVATRQVQLDAFQPTFAGQECNIELECDILSETSFHLRATIKTSEGVTNASVGMTLVFIDRVAHKRMAMPDVIKTKMGN